MMRRIILTVVAGSVGLLGACDNSAKSGALIGAGTGALAGQAIGHNTEGTLIGAGIGALGGALIGNEMDKKRAQEEAAARQNSPTYQQNRRTDQLQAENERLRAEIENERLRQQLESERDD